MGPCSTPAGSATRVSGAAGWGAAGVGCATGTAPSTRGSGWRASQAGRGCCAYVSTRMSICPCAKPTQSRDGPSLRDDQHHATLLPPARSVGAALHLPHSLISGWRQLPCLVPLLGLWAGGSRGWVRAGATMLKATHMEACFCYDLHLNDRDG